MFSLQKFFAKDDRLFDLLEAGAQACCESVQALKQMMRAPASDHSLDQFVAVRRKDKQINKEINELLARSSVTSLDPEDIESIARTLYKIPKTVEKFVERYLICSNQLSDVDFLSHISLLETATDLVARMMRDLQNSRFEEVKSLNDRLQTAEGDADKLMLSLLKEMYGGKHDPLKVVVLKDLYELLEKVVDRCRDVGNVVGNVVLKHS